MIRLSLFLVALTLGLSCIPGKQETKVKPKENIRFDFTAERMDAHKETIEIKASLFNDNTDTAYFLSSSCDGDQYSLRYDTAKFVLTPFMGCNASYPCLLRIAPKGQYDFVAHFRYRANETKIKLGFDFYSVDGSFDPNKVGLGRIHGRQEEEQTVLWASEKTIK